MNIVYSPQGGIAVVKKMMEGFDETEAIGRTFQISRETPPISHTTA